MQARRSFQCKKSAKIKDNKPMKKFTPKLRFILFNLLAAILLVCGIGFYVLSQLDAYTRHGYSIAVPDFSGFTPQEATEVATHDNLRILVIDSIYDRNAQPGTVVEQYPAAASRVKENRLIHLIINARTPEKVAFPNLQNAAYRHTLQTLQARGFKIGRIEYAPSEFKNLVLGLRHREENIQTGDMLPKGAVIDIVLGEGSGNNFVYVPSLLGKKLSEAIELLRASYLNIGEIGSDGSVGNGNEKYSAIVYEQFPAHPANLQAGSSIDLKVTIKREKISALDSLIVTE